MKKKAQISFFLAMAVIIAIVVGVYFAISTANPTSRISDSKFEVSKSLEGYVEDCIKETAIVGLMKLGLQGGYYNLPDKYFSTIFTNMPYYYYHGELTFPSISTMEEELSNYVKENIGYCLNDFESYWEMGYDIEEAEMSVETIIAQEDVSVELNYPLTIISDVDSKRLKSFQQKIDVKLKTIYDVSMLLLSEVMVNPNSLSQSYLLDLSEAYGLNINTMTSSDGNVGYVIEDVNSNLQRETNFMFVFATKTDLTEKKPSINMADSFNAIVGEKLLISIDAYDENDDLLEYYSNSSIIYPNTYSGIISFVPSEEDIGTHSVKLEVFDGTFTESKEITVVVGDS